MKNLVPVLISSIIILLTNCQSNEGNIQIRLKNSSNFDYKNTYIHAGLDEHAFGDLAAGDYSEYHDFKSAYSYTYVQLEIDNKTFVIQPIDYVGEEELDSGKFTYTISIDTSKMVNHKPNNRNDYYNGDDLTDNYLDSLANVNDDALDLDLQKD